MTNMVFSFAHETHSDGERYRLRKLLSYTLFALATFSFVISAPDASANATYYTYIDNEDNAGSGLPDDDLDTLINAGSSNHPIEFNIDMTGALPTTSAHLTVHAFDVDEEAGELDEVYINGNLLGTLAGENNQDSTTAFEVPIGQVVSGNNLIQIRVPAGGWALRAAWGQLLIDGGAEENSSLTAVTLTDYEINAATVTLDIEVNANILASNNYRLDLNLVDPNNNIITLAREEFTGTAGEPFSNTYQLTYSVTDPDAIFSMQAQLFQYVAGFPVQEDIRETDFEHILNLGPHLPAVPEFSTLSASNFAVVGDGITPTTITLQGVDASGANTTYDNQTVTISSDLGTMSSVSDLGDGTYIATLVAPNATGTATVTATIDGVTVTDTATISFVPGPPDADNTTISTSSPTIEANGSSTTTVTVQTIDEFGNLLTSGGQSVLLATTRGTLSAVSDLGDGRYIAILTSSNAIGTATVTGVLNGIGIQDDAVVNFITGPANSTNTIISSSLSDIYADGVTEALITVQAVDTGGNLIFVGGDTVALGTNLGTIGAVTDNNDGTYTATLRSGLAIGSASVTGTINGSLIADNASVDFEALPTVDILGANTGTPDVTGTVTIIDGASFAVSLNGQTYIPTDGNLNVTSGTWTLSVPQVNALTDGIYSVTATVTDAAGQTSSDTTASELVIDQTAPTIALNALSIATSTNILAYNISGTCTDIGDDISLNLADEQSNELDISNINCVDLGAGGVFNHVLDISALRDGTITITATITDIGGNEDQDATTITKNGCLPDDSAPLCDSDGDGVPDGIEETTGTLPAETDSDGDSIEDDIEYGSDFSNPLDTDGDGVIDALDLDSDNDGIPDGLEVGPDPSSPRDTDGDGALDFRDRDSDADYVPDAAEYAYFTIDPDGDGLHNFIDLDSDNDGIPDALENGVALHSDSDGDGIDDAFDVDSDAEALDINNDGLNDAIRLLDTDQDGRYNMFDIDSDNDGIRDTLESNLTVSADSDGDGINDFFDVDVTTRTDADQDGIDDLVQVLDSDGDSVPNYLDIDSDNDTYPDVTEAGGTDLVPVDSIIDDADNTEGTITSPTDSDNDGIPNYLDLESSNAINNKIGPFDIEGRENANALDRNNNGVIDTLIDTDSDGMMDEVDETLFNFGSYIDHDDDGILNDDDLDDDNDGLVDTLEGSGLLDSDQDGWADNADLDSDNDGITDLRESGSNLVDEDNDGVIDNFSDQDSNGLDDSASTQFQPIDTDNDGTADYLDLDSDGDTIFDIEEANEESVDLSLIDADEDGQADALNARGVPLTLYRPIDTDGDGAANYVDTDSDNDGIPDRLENEDADNNNVNDRLEAEGGELETSVQGAGSMDYLIMALLLITMGLMHYKKVARWSKYSFLLVLVSSGFLISEPSLADPETEQVAKPASTREPVQNNQEEVTTEASETEPDTDSTLHQCGSNSNGLFQHCIYSTFELAATNLEPQGSNNGWRVDEKNSFGGSIGIGWLFAPQWALEAKYHYLGKAGLGNSNPVLDSSIDAKLKYQAPSLMLAYSLFPSTEQFNVNVRLGAAWVNTDVNTNTVQFDADTSTRASVGASFSYRFEDSPWFMSLEYSGLTEDANSFGLQIGRYLWRSNRTQTEEPSSEEEMMSAHYKRQRLVNPNTRDTDQDGVNDIDDLCPLSTPGEAVDEKGCCLPENGCTVTYPK